MFIHQWLYIDSANSPITEALRVVSAFRTSASAVRFSTYSAHQERSPFSQFMATPYHCRRFFIFSLFLLCTAASTPFGFKNNGQCTAASTPLNNGQCAAASASLRFKNSGRFKILQVADMHYADGVSTKCEDVLPEEYPSCSDLNTTFFVKRMIDAEKPDLIVFTGDNIYGPDATDATESLKAAFEPAIAAKLPWAAVLGNHDQESTLNREEVMKHIVSMDYTLSALNPDNYDASVIQKIDGFGNYNVEVGGVIGSELEGKSVLNLYFLDSGDYSTVPGIPGYGWIKPTQQFWFKNTSATLQKAYKSDPPAQTESAPGLVYFHIPLPEVNNLDTSSITGVKQERISSPQVNSGFLTTMVEAGDVKAVFTGHDHVNDFCGKVTGIELCYAGGFGYHAYGKAGWPRRSRVVLASLDRDDNKGGWIGVKSITTWKRLDDEKFSKIDFQTLWTKP